MVAGDASTGELLIYNDCEASMYLNHTGAGRLDIGFGDRYMGGELVGSNQNVYVDQMNGRISTPGTTEPPALIEFPPHETFVARLLSRGAVKDCQSRRSVDNGRILLTFVIPALLLEDEEIPELPPCSASSCACSDGTCNPLGMLCQNLPDNVVFEDFIEVELGAWKTW